MPPPLRFPRPADDVLEHMTEHVHYELHRVMEFVLGGNVLPGIGAGEMPEIRQELMDWSQSSILESALIHLRNVSDFLTKGWPTTDRKMNATDLVAEHYFPDGHVWVRPDCIFGGGRARHVELIQEIHRRVAHLSTQRFTVKGQGAFEWEKYVRAQFPLLPKAFSAFLANLRASPDPRPIQWFGGSEALMVNYGLLPR
jgi:hypothetical protein